MSHQMSSSSTQQQTVKKLLTQIPVPTLTGNQQAVNVSSWDILVVNSLNDTRIYVNTCLYTLNWSASRYGSNATDLLMEPLFFLRLRDIPQIHWIVFSAATLQIIHDRDQLKVVVPPAPTLKRLLKHCSLCKSVLALQALKQAILGRKVELPHFLIVF